MRDRDRGGLKACRQREVDVTKAFHPLHENAKIVADFLYTAEEQLRGVREILARGKRY